MEAVVGYHAISFSPILNRTIIRHKTLKLRSVVVSAFSGRALGVVRRAQRLNLIGPQPLWYSAV